MNRDIFEYREGVDRQGLAGQPLVRIVAQLGNLIRTIMPTACHHLNKVESGRRRRRRTRTRRTRRRTMGAAERQCRRWLRKAAKDSERTVKGSGKAAKVQRKAVWLTSSPYSSATRASVSTAVSLSNGSDRSCSRACHQRKKEDGVSLEAATAGRQHRRVAAAEERRGVDIEERIRMHSYRHYPRRILGKSKIRILTQRGQKAFDSSEFRRGAKCCMGAPRGNDFLFAPLGAGVMAHLEVLNLRAQLGQPDQLHRRDIRRPVRDD